MLRVPLALSGARIICLHLPFWGIRHICRFPCSSLLLFLVKMDHHQRSLIENLYQSLKHVDTHQKCDRVWLQPVIDCILANKFEHFEDLRGAELAMLPLSQPCGPQLSFLRRTLDDLNNASGGAGGGLDALRLANLVQAPKRKVIVDIPRALEGASLTHLPSTAWPDAEFVDWLKEQTLKLKAAGVPRPFIYVDLEKHCVPPWAADHASFAEPEEECQQAAAIVEIARAIKGDTSNRRPKHLSVICWMAALLRFGLAAEFAEMWPLAFSMAHLDICLRVGEESRAKGKPQYLACVYDRLVRKKWSRLARACDPQFDLSQACKVIDGDILLMAESEVASPKQVTEVASVVEQGGRHRHAQSWSSHDNGQLALTNGSQSSNQSWNNAWVDKNKKRKRH